MLSSGAPSGIGRHALFMNSTTVPRLWHKRNFAVSTTPMVADQRGLLTGTYDSSTKTGTLDLDGQQVGSSNAGANTVDPGYQPAAIPGRFYYRLRVTLIPWWEKILPWIKEYSPYELAGAGDPPVYLHYADAPAPGQKQKDPTHSSNFGVPLQKKLQAAGVECHLMHLGLPALKYPDPVAFLIDRLKQKQP